MASSSGATKTWERVGYIYILVPRVLGFSLLPFVSLFSHSVLVAFCSTALTPKNKYVLFGTKMIALLLVQWCFACLCNTCGTAATCFGQVRESKRIQVLTGMSGPFLFLCMRNKALKFFTPFTLKVHPQRLKFCGDV